MRTLIIAALAIAFSTTLLYSVENVQPRGIELDGDKVYIFVPDDGSLSPDAITVEAWFKVNSFESKKMGANNERQFILFKKNKLEESNEGFAVYLFEETKSLWATVSSPEGRQVHVSAGENSIATGRWYHLAMTADDKNLRLYLDGELVAESSTGFKPNFDMKPLYIGDRCGEEIGKTLYGGRFNGFVDELKVWNQVRSREQLADDMTEIPLGTAKGLLLYLPFEEKDAVIAKDASFADNDGIVVNKLPESKINKSLALSPNPVSSSATLSFELSESGYVEISVKSIDGSSIQNVFKGELDAGSHKIMADMNSLPGGSYIASVKQGPNLLSKSFIVVK